MQVALETVEDGFGETKLSREKSQACRSWKDLEAAHEANDGHRRDQRQGQGGFTVDINTIRAFLPGSLVDVRPVRETVHLEGRNWNSKSSSWTRSATTWWYHVAP